MKCCHELVMKEIFKRKYIKWHSAITSDLLLLTKSGMLFKNVNQMSLIHYHCCWGGGGQDLLIS